MVKIVAPFFNIYLYIGILNSNYRIWKNSKVILGKYRHFGKRSVVFLYMLINSNDEINFIGTKEDGKPLNAFIIDDSAAMVKIVSRTLTDFGFNIVGSGINGEDALNNITKIKDTTTIDLVTLDITMPKMDGLAALPHILKLLPTTKVIMVSALGDKNRVIQAMQNGAHYYIVKPFRKETFYVVLRRIFKA